MTLKEEISDYTEAEFLAVITELYENRAGRAGKDLEAFRDEIVINFKRLTEHPNGSDVIFYPPEGAEKSPQGVVNRVKEWRAANGKPGFKPA